LSPETVRRVRIAARSAAALLLALAASGCRQDMHDAPRYKPLAASDFFADGASARSLPAHAVARGQLREDPLFQTGTTPEGDIVAVVPMPVTRELLARGRERYGIFCAPCHGATGDGRGMVVQRGYKQPSSYHVDRLRQVPVGYLFDVMTNGFGVMPSYAAQVPPEDRWAIAAYVRALQLSQYFDAGALTGEERARLDAPAAASAGAPAGH
jgi:mono/diheme cytochrome c family protein